MKTYLHRVLGLYETTAAAELAREKLARGGMQPLQLTLLLPGLDGLRREIRADSDDVLVEVLRDGAIGVVVGLTVGALGTIALTIARASLFDSGPILGMLIMLGWGATIGGLVGALVGTRNHKGEVADLIHASLATGHVVLIAHAASEAQTALARVVLGESLRNPHGVVTQT